MCTIPTMIQDLNDEPQTLLGFDFGRKRIGVAVGQSLTGTASPLSQIDATHDYLEAIEKIIQQWRPQILIVGHPIHMDESESHMSKAATQFAKQLEQRFNLPVHLIDERLSTREAKQRIEELKGNKRYTKEQLNSVAAQVILETWLQQISLT